MNAMPASPTDIVISIDDDAWSRHVPAIRDHVRKAAITALATVDAQESRSVEVSVMLTDDAALRRLNKTYRQIDKATNVLSFPAGDTGPAGTSALPSDLPCLLGDVVLAVETVAAEAARDGKKFADHTAHLIVHGILHLLGYDHEGDDEAALMERLEVRILSRLGVADPYGCRPGETCEGQ